MHLQNAPNALTLLEVDSIVIEIRSEFTIVLID